MPQISKLSRNIIYNLFGQGLLLILGFVAVKYVFKQLGEDALGIIYFTLTMNAVLCAVLEMGICSTTVREVSAHFNDEPGYIRNLIRTFSLFYWVAYVLLAVIIYFVAPILVDKWINLKTLDAATATQVLQILGISALLALPRSLYASLFRGLERMEFNNLIDVVITGLQQLGIIVILALGGGIVRVACWFAICFGISILMYLSASHHFFSWQALIPRYSPGVIRRNLGFSLSMIFISILAMIHSQIDKLVVSKLLPIGILGYYAFASSTVSKATLVTGSITQAAFPSFSALFQNGNRARMMTQYRKLHDLLCFTAVPLFAAIPFAALPLFSYLFNAEVAQMLLLPITLLCIGFYMNGTVHVPYIFSLAVGKPEITARSHFYALLVGLPVTVLLIYRFGLIGAALSLVFHDLFLYVYWAPKVCSECLKISVWKWYLHVLKIFLLSIPTYGAAWITLDIIGNHSILALSIGYICSSIAFLIAGYFMIGEELQKTLFNYLQVFKKRLWRLPK